MISRVKFRWWRTCLASYSLSFECPWNYLRIDTLVNKYEGEWQEFLYIDRNSLRGGRLHFAWIRCVRWFPDSAVIISKILCWAPYLIAALLTLIIYSNRVALLISGQCLFLILPSLLLNLPTNTFYSLSCLSAYTHELLLSVCVWILLISRQCNRIVSGRTTP